MKEILEQIEVRFDPQERLAEIDKDRNMKNRIRGQVMYLNPPMVKNTSEEIRNRKIETSKNIGMKNNRFIHPLMGKGLPIRSPPMDHVLGLKKILLYKTKQMEIGTLTRSPPVSFRSISSGFAHLPPPSRLLGCHGSEEKMILSCFTLGGLAVASFSRQSEARVDELVAAEQTKPGSVLNLDSLKAINKQSQWQFS